MGELVRAYRGFSTWRPSPIPEVIALVDAGLVKPHDAARGQMAVLGGPDCAEQGLALGCLLREHLVKSATTLQRPTYRPH
jgi:hypothetical protein